MSLFNKKYFYSLESIDKGHHLVTYKGVSAIKCPFDYTLYQMIVWEVQPDLIIEIGTKKGGSALYMADLLELNKKGELHTIDLPENAEDPKLHLHPRITVFKNGFENYDTSVLSGFQAILVVEDGSHQYKDSLAALNKFSPFVTTGSYFIVEDGIVSELGKEKEFNGGPQKAIKEFLEKDNTFMIVKNCAIFLGRMQHLM